MNFTFKNTAKNRSLALETARRAMVRKAIRADIWLTKNDIELFIEGTFTDEQIKGITKYTQYLK